jgi:hypothetical protein
VSVPDSAFPNSPLQIEAIVKNDRTGHDIPSSVTFVRQMWLEVTVTSGADTIYKSGYFDANGDLMDEHSQLQPNGDPDLVLFQSVLFKNGLPGNVVTADSILQSLFINKKDRKNRFYLKTLIFKQQAAASGSGNCKRKKRIIGTITPS